jgi:predicted GNAT family acetyltransferase
MHVQRYTDPEAFYQRVEAHLMAHEAENNLVFGILSNVRRGDYENPYMAVVEHEGALVLVALRTPPHRVIFSTDDAIEAALAVAEDLRGSDQAGVTGAPQTARAFAEAWSAANGKRFALEMPMHIYKLDRVIPAQRVAGTLRRADPVGDHDLLKKWVAGFEQDTFGETDVEEVERTLQFWLNSTPDTRGLFLWEIDGQPVTMTGYAGPTPHGIRVNYVYTPPEFRRRGYASACVAAVTQYLLDSGRKFCFLFTDRNNPTSNHIYQEIGYELVCDADSYEFL